MVGIEIYENQMLVKMVLGVVKINSNRMVVTVRQCQPSTDSILLLLINHFTYYVV